MTRKQNIDVDYLSRFLLGSWPKERLESRALTAQPEFQRIDGLPMAEHRDRVLGQLKLLVQNGAIQRAFPKKFGGADNHGGNIAAFEELVLADPSMQIKSGVQWGLFGAAVLHLGTAEHHKKYLPGILSLETPGIFAMTESGHGSDVDSIATTATFDAKTDEFVINTPFRQAWKDYLGNAALHGKAAVVFAQLILNRVNHGVHAFFVPIRDDKGEFLSGVGGDDDGLKGGLNGIDNGRLHFSGVRIPRTALLNRYGDVDKNGVYSSPIESPGRRFFTMIGTLVQGRVSLDGASVIASQLASCIAVSYGNQRRQFPDPETKRDVVLLDYQRHQRRLFTRLAKTYAITFSHDVLLRKFDEVFSGAGDTAKNREELETLAAALKSYSTWHALDTLQETREACGGAGFLAENRVAALRADLDIFVTFEGDNNVLLQLVGKRLLTDYSDKFKKDPAGTMLNQLVDRVINRTGLRQLAQKVMDFGLDRLSYQRLVTPESITRLMQARIAGTVAEIGGALAAAGRVSKAAGAAAFNDKQNDLIVAGYAYSELLQYRFFTEALARITDSKTREALTLLRDLFGLNLIEKHAAALLTAGLISKGRVRAASRGANRLLRKIRPNAQDLVDAFGLKQEHIRAFITSGAEATRQEEAWQYVQDQRASGSEPVHEKVLRKAGKTVKAATE